MKELRIAPIETDGKLCGENCRWLEIHDSEFQQESDGVSFATETHAWCSFFEDEDIPDLEYDDESGNVRYLRNDACLKKVTLVALIYQYFTKKIKDWDLE